MVAVHFKRIAARRIHLLAIHCLTHRIHRRGAGLRHRLRPHPEADKRGFHRVIRHAARVLDEGLPLRLEFRIGGAVHAHEVVPGGQVADQRLGVNAGQFFFTDRESNGWNVFRLDPLIAEFPIERNIRIAIDGGHNRGALAFAGKALHARHNALPIGMAEGRIFFHDIGIRDALAVQEGAQNAVGGARIDIVGAEQRNAARLTTILRHQIFNRRNRLLVRRGAGVEDIA